MRLIDADTLEYMMCEEFGISENDDATMIYGMVINAPTIDAVEVVRCYKCRYSKDTNDYQDTYFCNHPTHNRMHLVHSFDYCSYGEVKHETD